MIKASAPELQLHTIVLTSHINSLSALTDRYSRFLVDRLNRWYNHTIHYEVSFAYEAVYDALRTYSDHPRRFNPEHGTLVRYLELAADRAVQRIFERERIQPRVNSIDHFLALHFENEQDVQLARLMMKGRDNLPALVQLLDIGSYRIEHQLTEIRRHTTRIRKKLDASGKKWNPSHVFPMQSVEQSSHVVNLFRRPRQRTAF